MKLHPAGYPILSILYTVSSYIGLSATSLVNITVDDTNPDPLTGNVFTYSPADRWNQGNGCALCTAQPSASLAHDGTWHDATYRANNTAQNEVTTASFDFNGRLTQSLLW